MQDRSPHLDPLTTLEVDRERLSRVPSIGLPVVARLDGVWGSHDLAHLTTASLVAWLRRGGERNERAERLVCMLLVHVDAGDVLRVGRPRDDET